MIGKRKLVGLLLAVLLLAGGFVLVNGKLTSAADVLATAPAADRNVVSVQGEGVVNVVPDVAYVTLGVETSNKQMKAAQAANREAMNGVVAELKRLGIDQKDIQTQSYNVSPDYRWEDNKSTLVGYKVSNLVRIRIVNIDRTGEILDAIAVKGANVVHGIQFTVADQKKAYHDALRLALKDAEDKAKLMVAHFGITELSPIEIVESPQYSAIPYNVLRREAADMEAGTPISPGEMEIRAQVGVSFEY